MKDYELTEEEKVAREMATGLNHANALRLVKNSAELVRQLGGINLIGEIPLFNLQVSPSEQPCEDSFRRVCNTEGLYLESLMHKLDYYFCGRRVFRNVTNITHTSTRGYLAKKLKFIAKTGFDKSLTQKIWLSEYPSKIFEYEKGVFPKLILAYDFRKVLNLEGAGEGYEWQFLVPPKQALDYILWIEEQGGQNT